MELSDSPVAKLGTTRDPLLTDSPTTRSKPLAISGDRAIGVWEIDAGTAHDVEVDEVFIVLTGSATITVDGHAPVLVGPGDIVHLAEGAATTWQVHERLRKVYIAPVDGTSA